MAHDVLRLLGSEARAFLVLEASSLAPVMEKASGEKLPAFSYGNPDLYIMAKEGGGKLAVGLWNFHPDAVKRPVIELKKEYKNAKFFNCTGTLEGDRLSLSRLEAFGFCFAELSV